MQPLSPASALTGNLLAVGVPNVLLWFNAGRATVVDNPDASYQLAAAVVGAVVTIAGLVIGDRASARRELAAAQERGRLRDSLDLNTTITSEAAQKARAAAEAASVAAERVERAEPLVEDTHQTTHRIEGKLNGGRP